MKISKNALQARIHNLSKDLNVSANMLLASFFFDAFIVRLANSSYADNFIFKGGFYLATLLGIQNRYKVDIDFLLKRQKLEAENLKSIIFEIIAINVGDGIAFDFQSVSPIREQDDYGGYSVSLVGHFENIRQVINIDIATGDPITPSEIAYSYKRFLSDETITFRAYNLETVLAEKMQTILTRGLLNSRCKDFYDVYIIQKLRWDSVNVSDLKLAFSKTCDYRKTTFTKEEAEDLLSQILHDEIQLNRWKNYVRKSSFAKDVQFEEVISACQAILSFIF